MEGDFIRKSCCGETFGHKPNCTQGQALRIADRMLDARRDRIESLRADLEVAVKALEKLGEAYYSTTFSRPKELVALLDEYTDIAREALAKIQEPKQ